MIWRNPKMIPARIEGKIYSEDILLLVDGEVYTGYYNFAEFSNPGFYIFLPRFLEDQTPIKCIPDGWMPRNVLPLTFESQYNLF